MTRTKCIHHYWHYYCCCYLRADVYLLCVVQGGELRTLFALPGGVHDDGRPSSGVPGLCTDLIMIICDTAALGWAPSWLAKTAATCTGRNADLVFAGKPQSLWQKCNVSSKDSIHNLSSSALAREALRDFFLSFSICDFWCLVNVASGLLKATFFFLWP